MRSRDKKIHISTCRRPLSTILGKTHCERLQRKTLCNCLSISSSPFCQMDRQTFSYFSPTATLSSCYQDRSYQYHMPLTFKQCHIEINSNGGLKLESYSSNNWKHISSTTIPITTKLGGVVTYHEGLSPIKSNDPLIMLSFKIKWQTKNISTTRVPLAKKHDRITTYCDGLLPIKSHDTWS